MRTLLQNKSKGAIAARTAFIAAVILIAACAIMYAGRNGLAYGNEDKSKSNGAPSEAPPREVIVSVVHCQSLLLTTEMPGRASPFLVGEIRPQVSGLIQERLFAEGADVEAGQTLYQIDPALFQAAVNNAEAGLEASSKAARQARAALEASLAGVEQQKAVLELAEINRRRLVALAKDGAVSLMERDQIVMETNVAKAALRSAEAQVKRAREAVQVADASIKQAAAMLETVRINLQYTSITAPISGRIGRSHVTVGAMVTAYQPQPLATIQQLDPIYVDVPQSTADLLRLRHRLQDGRLNDKGPGLNTVRLLLEDGTEYSREGTFQFRDVTVDPSTDSVILRIVFPNPDGLLLPGMFVRAAINEGVNPAAMLVPQQGVTRDRKGNPLTLIVNDTNEVEQRKITLDRAMGDQWLVVGGLDVGDRVIIEGLQWIKPGSAVKVASSDVGEATP
jgi:membrane fusion protein, multidrug efflux system